MHVVFPLDTFAGWIQHEQDIRRKRSDNMQNDPLYRAMRRQMNLEDEPIEEPSPDEVKLSRYIAGFDGWCLYFDYQPPVMNVMCKK